MMSSASLLNFLYHCNINQYENMLAYLRIFPKLKLYKSMVFFSKVNSPLAQTIAYFIKLQNFQWKKKNHDSSKEIETLTMTHN